MVHISHKINFSLFFPLHFSNITIILCKQYLKRHIIWIKNVWDEEILKKT
jgi:hypothetical protein